MSVKVVFKAALHDALPQIVGEYVFSSEEWEEEMSDYSGSEEDWLKNRGVDWAHEAVHSDCLNYWAEIERE
jgi:hypothetical protein